MAFFRRLSSVQLLVIGLAWIIGGELVTTQYWFVDGQAKSVIAALLLGKYSNADLSISYSAIPWLSVMILGWIFGRYILDYGSGKVKISPARLLLVIGFSALGEYVAICYMNGYGNMFLYRDDLSWRQWLHVSIRLSLVF